jgi:predicted nucleic acid-binding protein
MRIFLDANILFSAARADGAIRQMLTLLQNAKHSCWVDAFVLEEARRNLAAKAPSGLAELETMLEGFHTATMQPRDLALEAGFPLPEKDRPVLSAAIRAKCDALVTGDRAHFGPLYGQCLHGVTICSPAGLAEELF